MRFLSLLVQFGVLAAIVGCGDGRPNRNFTFHPVTGRVLQGDRPLKGGLIQFIPLNDPDIVARATTDENGNFTMKSSVSHPTKNDVPGVPAGEYKVIVRPPGPPGKALPSYTVPETKIVLSGENEFTVQLSAGR